MIGLVHPADLPLLPAIGASAAALFAGTVMAHVIAVQLERQGSAFTDPVGW